MKNAKKILALFLITLHLGCNIDSKQDALTSINPEQLVNSFFDSGINKISPKKTKIKFSVQGIRNNEIDYLYDFMEKEYLKDDIDEGFIKGLAIYHFDNGTEKINNEDIFAFSVYDIKSKNQIIHKFYLKENDSFLLKKELMETFMNTETQNFLVWKFKNNDFSSTKNISVSRFYNIDDDVFSKRRTNTRNEFNLFILRNVYPNTSLLQKNSSIMSYQMASLADCSSGCEENWTGTCDGGYYCIVDDSDDTICESSDTQEISYQSSVTSKTTAETLFNLELQRSLRDDFLVNNYQGQKIVDYYYAISEFVLVSDYKVSTVLKMVETLPSFNQSINILLNNDASNNDILITSTLENKITSIINDYKLISDNTDFHYILDDVQNTINSLENKNKNEFILAFD